MTQIRFIAGEEITATRLNQATQGYKFLRRTTYAGSAGSPVGSGPTAVSCATWFVGSGTAALFVRVCGPGAGGGACQGGLPTNTSGAGSGGGGGGYAEGWILSGFGSQQVVKIGRGGLGGNVFIGDSTGASGGASAFGGFITATSGSGGLFINNTGALNFTAGGDGGFASGGDLNQGGSGGGVGFVFADNNPVLSGRGGQSAFGSGGREITTGFSNGDNGNLYGGGGGGACVERAPSVTSRLGGNGAPGFVMVDEYA